MKKYLFFALAAFGTMLSSCSDDDTPQQMPPMPESEFTFTETALTSRSAVIRVTPQDVTTPYISMIVSQTAIDTFPTIDEFYEWLYEECNGMGYPMTTFMYVGPDDVVGSQLTPGEKYALAAYHCTDLGLPVTGAQLYVHEFTVLARSETHHDIQFDIQVSDIMPDGATITVKPTNDNFVYATFAGDNAIIEASGTLLAAAQYMISYMESQGTINWSDYDSSDNLRRGEAVFKYSGIFAGNKKQAVICFAVNAQGEVVSDVGYAEFNTPAPEPSDMTFMFEVQNLTFNSVNVIITPSNPDETYYADVVVKSYFEEMGEQEFMEFYMQNYVLQSADEFLAEEPGYLEPNTEYMAFAFGAHASCATTPFFTREFTTPDFVYKSGGDAWVGQEVVSIVDGALIMYNGYGIVNVEYAPNESTVEYFIATPEQSAREAWDNMSDDDLKRTIILNPGSTNHPSNTCVWFDMLNNTLDLYVVGMDDQGRFGDVNKMPVRVLLSASINALSSMAEWVAPASSNGMLSQHRAPVSAASQHAAR